MQMVAPLPDELARAPHAGRTGGREEDRPVLLLLWR